MYPSTTTVAMGIALRQLQQLDEPKQVLTTVLWLRVDWSDCRLTWNMSEWQNISRLIVPYSSVWTPDLTLYDNAETTITSVKDYRLSVSHEGAVSHKAQVVLSSLCQLDVSRFPFDTQICNLTFGSWAYNGLELNLTSSEEPADMGHFVPNGEWFIVSLTALRTEPLFTGVPYPQMIFTLVLRRRHLFYILSLLFPCALIQLMASLAFLLPCETNEKVGLEITVLLSLAVMQLVIMKMIPASSETLPIIGVYFMLAMIIVSLSCLMTVTVLAIHYPNRHRPLPPRARAILRCKMAQWLGIDTATANTMQPNTKRHSGRTAEPDVTTHAPRHHHKRQTSSNDSAAGALEMSRIYNICDDFVATGTDVINTDIANPYDITDRYEVISPHDVSHDDSNVSFSYSVEGERGKRRTYRPPSAVSSRLANFHFHRFPGEDQQRPLSLSATERGGEGEGELWEMVAICREMLDCMRAGKKHGDHHERMSNKAARREWELMAQLLDRVFLLVFSVLTIAMFAYVYGSIV